MGEDSSASSRRQESQKTLATHDQCFKAESVPVKLRYELMARRGALEKRLKNNAKIQVLEERLSEKVKLKEKEEACKPQWRIAMTGWNAEDLETLNRKMQDPRFSGVAVAAAREAALHDPSIPVATIRNAMLECGDPVDEDELRECPVWLADACRHRNHYCAVALLWAHQSSFGSRCSEIFCLVQSASTPAADGSMLN